MGSEKEMTKTLGLNANSEKHTEMSSRVSEGLLDVDTESTSLKRDKVPVQAKGPHSFQLDLLEAQPKKNT